MKKRVIICLLIIIALCVTLLTACRSDCKHDYNEDYVCKKCGYEHSHTFGEWQTVTQPTCQKEGSQIVTCTNCGFVKTDVIEKLEHDYNGKDICAICGEKADITPDNPNEQRVIMLWGDASQREIMLKYANEFKLQHPEAFKGYTFDFADKGDYGAYANMAVDPTRGAAIYTFDTIQMASIANLGALSQLVASDVAWSQANNSAASVEATKLVDTYLAYPLQADNGFFMQYNKQYFVGTSIWDSAKDDLKDGYTMKDLYSALDEKGADTAKIMWPMGDSWYVSGVFFGVGGDYSVVFDENGRQQSADCNFGYTIPQGGTTWKDGDYTVGYTAVQCLLNTFMDNSTQINKHFMYAGDVNTPYNEMVSLYTDSRNFQAKQTPLVATVNGIWMVEELKNNWGEENYRATVLPMLEDDQGNKYPWKTFATYKQLGVNPLCEFVRDNPNNIEILHQLAQYLTSKEIQIEYYQQNNSGPSNKQALQDPVVKSNLALQALNAQYDRICSYPTGHPKAGQPIGNGIGCRVQDTVPVNYWTPVQNFSRILYEEYSTNQIYEFSAEKLKLTLAILQDSIIESD